MSRLARLCALVVLSAVLAVLPAAGASAALHTGSSTGPIIAANTTVNGAILSGTPITFQSSFFGTEITCNNSSIAFVSSNYGATPVALSVTSLSFTNCTSGCGATTVTISGLPWTGSSLATTTAPNGTFLLKMPGQNMTFSTCGLSCSYGTGSGGISATFTGGNPAFIKLSASMPSSSCFDTASWMAGWQVTGPAGNGVYTS